MSDPYARLRVRREQAELLYDILFEERGRLIAEKISARSAGKDSTDMRADLVTVKYLMEEAKRAIDDIDSYGRGYKQGRAQEEDRARREGVQDQQDARIGNDAPGDR